MQQDSSCPTRILHYARIAIGLSWCALPYYACRGALSAPRGHRFAGAKTLMKAREPVLAGSFALWAAAYGGLACSITRGRGVDDRWNQMLAASAAFVLCRRVQPALRRSVETYWGLALLEVISIKMDEWTAERATEVSQDETISEAAKRSSTRP